MSALSALQKRKTAEEIEKGRGSGEGQRGGEMHLKMEKDRG